MDLKELKNALVALDKKLLADLEECKAYYDQDKSILLNVMSKRGV